jgi:hypothetical protein
MSKMLLKAGQHALDFWLDTDDCLICSVTGARNKHEEWCPFVSLNELTREDRMKHYGRDPETPK